MERRFYLGIGILVLLLVVGIFCGSWINKANNQVVQYLSQAEEAVRAENGEHALALTRQAQKLWKQTWHRIAMVADHTSMDEIDGLFAQMEYYAQDGAALFGANCARVRELVSAVSDGHQLTWWNLL